MVKYGCRSLDLMSALYNCWCVYDRYGGELAEFIIPADLAIQQIGRDFVLALRRDEDGVISIVEYALTRR